MKLWFENKVALVTGADREWVSPRRGPSPRRARPLRLPIAMKLSYERPRNISQTKLAALMKRDEELRNGCRE